MTWEWLLYFPNTSLKGGHRWSCVLDSSVWSSVLLDWNWEFGHQLLLLSMVRGYLHLYYLCGRFTGTVVKNSPAHAGDTRQAVSVPGSGRSPEKKQPTPVFLPVKFHGQGSLVCYSPWGCKESERTEWLKNKQQTISLSPTLHSVMSYWYHEIHHGGSIYTTEFSKCCKSGLCVTFCWLSRLN